MYLYHNDTLPYNKLFLLKSFKLEIRFINNIQQDTLTFTDLKPVEQGVSIKKFLILFQGPS